MWQDRREPQHLLRARRHRWPSPQSDLRRLLVLEAVELRPQRLPASSARAPLLRAVELRRSTSATRHHFTLRLLHPLGSLRAATRRRRLIVVPASSRRDTAISPTGSAVSPTGTGWTMATSLPMRGSTEQWWGSGPEVRGWRIWARLRWIRRDPSRIDGGAPGSGGIVAIGGGSRRCGLCGCCNRCLSQASCCCVHTAAAGALLGQLGWKRWWIRIVSSPSLNYHLFVFSKFSITQYLYVLAMCLLVVKYYHFISSL
jgi:hypothetical protein